jgi:hypothetical protein
MADVPLTHLDPLAYIAKQRRKMHTDAPAETGTVTALSLGLLAIEPGRA